MCTRTQGTHRDWDRTVWASSVEVWVSSRLPQGQRLWVQQTWAWHKPSWRRSPLIPPSSCQTLHRTGKQTLGGHKQNLVYTWTSPDGKHRYQNDYILCSQRWRSSIQSAKTRPGVDSGSDHELFIEEFIEVWIKLKKVGNTIRSFKYDPNKIPYDYTVKVRNRFKGIDLIDRVSDDLWTEAHDFVQETGIKTIPKKKKCKKAKWLSEEDLQIADKRKEAKSKREKERFECRVPKNSK